MAQPTNLVTRYCDATVLSVKVGASDIVANTLCYISSGLLVIAGNNQAETLYVPLVNGKVGEIIPVAPLCGGNIFPLACNGAITAGARVAPAASGQVKPATTGDLCIGRAYSEHTTTTAGEVLSICGWTGADRVMP